MTLTTYDVVNALVHKRAQIRHTVENDPLLDAYAHLRVRVLARVAEVIERGSLAPGGLEADRNVLRMRDVCIRVLGEMEAEAEVTLGDMRRVPAGEGPGEMRPSEKAVPMADLERLKRACRIATQRLAGMR